ncbi:MAG: hypothetical protein L0154_00685 [Chloroflexi bacterium]|nr:hypothetical protein [Chloroflexota bacterium]
MLKRLLLIAAFILPLAVFQGTEAGGRWSFYVLNQQDNALLRIYEDGEIEELDLGLEEGQIVATRVAVYPNENLTAFCSVIPNGADVPVTTFHVRDLTANVDRINILLESGECNVSPHSFSTNGSSVAYGTLQGIGEWKLTILDTASGEVLHELTALPVDEDHYVMPDPLVFPGNTITFAMVMWGTERGPNSPAFVWNLETGDVEQDDAFGYFKVDYLSATRELAWVDLDEDRPAAQPGGPIPTSNVVRVRDEAVTDVYYNEEEVITGVRFIDNGQALAINLLSPFDMDNPGEQTTRWVRLDREGNVSEIASNQGGFVDVLPFRNGYAVLNWTPQEGASLQTVVDGEMNQLWATEGDALWLFVGPYDGLMSATDAQSFAPAG